MCRRRVLVVTGVGVGGVWTGCVSWIWSVG